MKRSAASAWMQLQLSQLWHVVIPNASEGPLGIGAATSVFVLSLSPRLVSAAVRSMLDGYKSAAKVAWSLKFSLLGLIASADLLSSAVGRVLCNAGSIELRQVRKEAAVF